jgi:histidinol phosphatase-like enzyme
MALLAKNDFPEIDFTKSIMVGDKLSDMKFGKSVSMTTFCISTSYKNSSLIDYKISSLTALSAHLIY